MMPDLGDVTIGPGDVMALGRQSLTPGEAPAALVGAYPAEARYGSATQVMPADLTI
jgi:hypothetical protein